MSEHNCPRASELSSRIQPGKSAKVYWKHFYVCLRIVGVWRRESICRHIQPQCHQFQCLLLFFLSSSCSISAIEANSSCLYFSRMFMHRNIGKMLRGRVFFFFRNFLSQYKIDIFMCDDDGGAKENVFMLNWNFLIFILPENDFEKS